MVTLGITDILGSCRNFSLEAGGLTHLLRQVQCPGCRCHSHRSKLSVFLLFSNIADKKLVQTGLPEFIYYTLQNFPFLISLNKEPLHSKPLLVPQSDPLTFHSSEVTEDCFLILESSCGIPVTDPQITGNSPACSGNPASLCFSAPCTLD